MKIELVAAFAVAGACSLPWAQPATGGQTATPADKLAKKCKDLATRQERADCTKLARERRGGIARAGQADHPDRAASGTSDKMAVGAASAPVGTTRAGTNDGGISP
jgi:hypothetical protein